MSPTTSKSWIVKDRKEYSSRPKVKAGREERRKKVLELNKQDKNNGEIAAILGIDRGTVSGDLKYWQRQEGVTVKDNAWVSRRQKWITAIQSIIDYALPYFNGQGIKPSLRTVY
jgi:hypothetical protein